VVVTRCSCAVSMLARTLRAAVRLPGHHTIGAVSARCDVGAGCPGASQTRCWSAATDVEYRDRPATQPIPPRAGPATRLETLVDPGSLLKVLKPWTNPPWTVTPPGLCPYQPLTLTATLLANPSRSPAR
jgi:hypothetical protein